MLLALSVSEINSSEASTAPSGKDLDDVLPVASFLALSVIVMLVLDIIKEKYELMLDFVLADVRSLLGERRNGDFCFLREASHNDKDTLNVMFCGSTGIFILFKQNFWHMIPGSFLPL